MKRLMALGAVVAAVSAGSVALGNKVAADGAAAQGDGGLALSPALAEKSGPQPGPIATYTIANRSSAPLAVTVAPRPWKQTADGKVTVNRRSRLRGVNVDAASFTLAPGEQRPVTATLASAPSGGALYGALEVIGTPTDADDRKGVVLGYRLIGTIRVRPTTPRIRLAAGTTKVRKGTATISIRNRGNTVDPVTGSVRVRGGSGTRTRSVKAIRILPGESVTITMGTRLSSGNYTATVRLRQRNRVALSTTKRFKVR
ncbi:MAG TPA: hypothetical protein VFZ00_22070 [Solirubrobacter sp.]|nr:hypothetical protein [Solirubrobacter sp.]